MGQASHKSQHERPNTYFVQDRSNQNEMERLQTQDQLLTTSMGGVLPEQHDPAQFEKVLDVGCGTGNWLIETARTYPTIRELVGVDVSKIMLEYAQTQAQSQQVEDRVQFIVMDVLHMVEFPDKSFDLVNQRLGMSYLRTWDWPQIIEEYQRVTRRRGVIRITECDIAVKSTSPAYDLLIELGRQAMSNAGLLFHNRSDGVINELPNLLKQYGHTLQEVHTHPYTLVYRGGTPEGKHFVKDIQLAYQTLIPFLQKWTLFPKNYNEIYKKMVEEMQEPEFVATWNYLTVWGIKM
jgi:ubiquinone/menaquinone biosynthesis C-methylase UbiE